MKTAIMQPYFMPYIGYFQLIYNTDRFILLDDVQFARHGWIERNRILRQGGDWLYIKVPVKRKNGRETKIREVEIDNALPWKEKILAQLQGYKRKAPFYYDTVRVIQDVFSNEYGSITCLNRDALAGICRYLGIDREIKIFSDMGLEIAEPEASDEWALNICRALSDVSEYWNPQGGAVFFDRGKYERSGIPIRFIEPVIEPYFQGSSNFQGSLSIIDVMMFNPVEAIIEAMKTFRSF